ncbi:sperm protein associated with the nucleus on the X chromosome N4 [Microcebus murinus]|uniref:sperm protein associated with the nucleus on the X chromosome N4 n=1 Tax=Microcebus murinus TaxID=30608 RepID=UPI000642900F|nr:sperm protein associated with the nucleus on the X chromosome N4 [Microcebus murinus]
MAKEICTPEEPSIDMQQPTVSMEQPTPITKGRKEIKTLCQHNNKESDKVQMILIIVKLALQQNVNKMKKIKMPTIIVCFYRVHKKRNSNQLKNKEENPDNSIDPIKETRDLDLSVESSEKAMEK